MSSELLVWIVIAVWVVGIPIATGVASRIGTPMPLFDFLLGVFWPLVFASALLASGIWGLGSAGVRAFRGLFRLGVWLHGFFSGAKN